MGDESVPELVGERPEVLAEPRPQEAVLHTSEHADDVLPLRADSGRSCAAVGGPSDGCVILGQPDGRARCRSPVVVRFSKSR